MRCGNRPPLAGSVVWGPRSTAASDVRMARGAILRGMTDARRNETDDTGGTTSETPPGSVTLTTGRIGGDAVGTLMAALEAAGVVVERRTFLPTREDETSPQDVLLLAVAGPPLSLARLVAPATSPPSVVPALADALGIGPDADQAPRTNPATIPATTSVPATLQFKAEGVFIVVRVRDHGDLTRALDDLPAQVARLAVRRAERRLVYEAGTWQIDP